MPYYTKVSNPKSSAEKRSDAEKRGGFDDEGTRYSGTRTAGGGPRRSSSAARPQAGGTGAPKRSYGRPAGGGEARPYARKTEGGDGAPKRSYSRPAGGGEARPYARKTEGGEGAPKRSYGRPAGGGEARPYARKTEGGDGAPKRSYSRPAGGGDGFAKRSYSRPAGGGEARPYARKTEGGDGAPKRSYSRPAGGGEARPYARKTEGGEGAPKRSYSRPAGGEARPYARKTEGGEGFAKRSYSRPAGGGESRAYARKTEGGEGFKRSYSKPAGGGEARPYARKTEGGEGFAKRSYSRPEGSSEARPYARKTEGGEGFAKRSYSRPEGSGEARPYTRKPVEGEPRTERMPAEAQANGEPRFAPRTASPYRTRGEGITPKPYGEMKREYKQAYQSPSYYANRSEMPGADSEPENLLSGRNPIREALKGGRDIEKLLVAKGELSGSAREIVAMAKEQHVPIQEVDRARLDAITPNHQGMLAFASAYKYHTVDEMLALAAERGEKPFLVMLDGVTDPHNLGAVIRTAECAGAHGVIVQERRAVGLTPAAVKASAGAVEHIMVARVVNLGTTLDQLKEQGIWAYAADTAGEDYLAVDYAGGAVIVIGAEGEGVSRLVMEKCDKVVALPMRGKIGSLNASVAAGILLYAVLRSR